MITLLTTSTHIYGIKDISFVPSGMKYIKGQSRPQTQLFPISLEDAIDTNNEVRSIDLFTGSQEVTGSTPVFSTNEDQPLIDSVR